MAWRDSHDSTYSFSWQEIDYFVTIELLCLTLIAHGYTMFLF